MYCSSTVNIYCVYWESGTILHEVDEVRTGQCIQYELKSPPTYREYWKIIDPSPCHESWLSWTVAFSTMNRATFYLVVFCWLLLRGDWSHPKYTAIRTYQPPFYISHLQILIVNNTNRCQDKQAVEVDADVANLAAVTAALAATHSWSRV